MKLLRGIFLAAALLLLPMGIVINAQALTLFNGVTDVIEQGQGEKSWSFDGEAGQAVIFHAAGLLKSQQIFAERVDDADATVGSELQPTLQVYAPSGVLLAEVSATDDLHARTDAMSLPTSGRYTIIVKPQNDSYGQYVLAAAPANLELNLKQASLDETWTGITGSHRGESWSFDGSEGQSIEVEFNKEYNYSSGAYYLPSRLALISPDGKVLVRNTQERIDPLELPVDGTYTIQIDSNEEDNLLYTITVRENDTALVDGPMTYFETLHGSFPADEVNEWPYIASAGEVGILTIDWIESSGTVFASVLAPDGTEVAKANTASSGYGINFTWSAERDGEYTIIVKGSKGQPASYRITLTRDDPVDERLLNFGEPVTDVLRRIDETHVWAFEGQQGQDVLINVEGIEFALLMPDGQDYGSISGTYNLDNQQVRLTQTGTWKIQVHNQYNTEAYTPYVVRVDIPDKIVADSKLVELGQIVMGTGDYNLPDELQIDLQRGSYTLILREIDVPPSLTYYSYLNPEIVAPDGTRAYAYSSSELPPRAPYVQQFTLDVDIPGIHTIRFKPQYEGEQAGYMLAVLDRSTVPERFPLWVDGDIETNATMSINDSVVLQGLREEYDEDPTPNIVTFEGSAGHRLKVRLDFFDHNRENVIKIYDPDGNFMSESYSEENSPYNELIVTLPVDGEYKLEITTFIAPYQVTLLDAALDLHLGVIIDGMGYQRRRDVDGTNAQLNEWTFWGRAGQVIAIRMYQETSYEEYDPLVELFSPSGEFLTDNDDFDDLNAFIPSVTLPEDGLYRIVAQDYSGQYGDYHLSVLENGDQAINVYRAEAERIDACTVLTREAYSALTTACASTPSNEACILSAPITIQGTNGEQVLSEVGTRVSLADVRVLQSTPLDQTTNGYGMAYMRLPTQTTGGGAVGVGVVAIGNVSLLNPAIQNIALPGELPAEETQSAEATPMPRIALDLTVTAGSNINVRGGPSTNAAVVTTGRPGLTYQAVGRNPDSTWLYVELPDGDTGWMFGELVSVNGDPTTLPVTEAAVTAPSSAAQSGGSQPGAVSFYMTSSGNDSQCKRGPESGLMLYAPVPYEDMAWVKVNGVDIKFQGAVFIQAAAGASMTIYSVNGSAEVTAQNRTQYLYRQSRLTVLLDGDLNPAGAPGEAENFDYRIVRALPLSYVH